MVERPVLAHLKMIILHQFPDTFLVLYKVDSWAVYQALERRLVEPIWVTQSAARTHGQEPRLGLVRLSRRPPPGEMEEGEFWAHQQRQKMPPHKQWVSCKASRAHLA